MARAYPRGPTAEEEQRNLEAFSRVADRMAAPLAAAVDVLPLCDWCRRSFGGNQLPIQRAVLGSDERVPVRVCSQCWGRIWLHMPKVVRWWWRVLEWWNR